MVNSARIPKQNLAAIANRCLLCTLHFREKPWSELLHCFSLRSQPLQKSSWYYILTNGLRPSLSNQNGTAISSFTSLLTNQSSFKTSNQNALFQPIRSVLFGPKRLFDFGFFIYINMDQAGMGEVLSSYKRVSCLSPWSTFSVSLVCKIFA